MASFEPVIAAWRHHVDHGSAAPGASDALEPRLRADLEGLTATGLRDDEAMLVALKRLGAVDTATRRFMEAHLARSWATTDGPSTLVVSRVDGLVEALGFGLAAAVAVQLARLAAGPPGAESTWLLRNAGLLVLPLLMAYLARRRQLPARVVVSIAVPVVVTAVVVNLFPYRADSSTELLVAAHLPVLLWAAVAAAHMRGDVASHERRLTVVRATGEGFIHYVLVALGGGVLVGLTAMLIEPTGVLDPEQLVSWVLPSGAAGAVFVVTWLVDTRPRTIAAIAPLLTAIFTPLFAITLTVIVGVYAVTGLDAPFDRSVVGVLDALLVVVLGLVVYRVADQERAPTPGWLDRIQLVAVVSAVGLDVMLLGVMLVRIGDLGVTPNRAAAVGLNLVLLVNLSGAAWYSVRSLRHSSGPDALARWQTRYLTVLVAWSAVVVLAFPPLFSFV